MKIKYAEGFLAAVTLGAMLTSGCTTNTVTGAAEGATVGAVSASFVGALTDLVVDGRVNTYRLQRNLVGGAIAGGAAGAFAGSAKDRAVAQREPTRPQAASPDADAELISQIGKDNYEALVDLLNSRHETAYRKTLISAKSDNKPYRLSALAIQALIDRDRNDEAGMVASLQQFVAEDDEIKDFDEAKGELEVLHQELLDERRIRGIR